MSDYIQHIDENNVIVNDKHFTAIDAKAPDVCEGCYFETCDLKCWQLPVCGERSRKDKRDIIWVVQV